MSQMEFDVDLQHGMPSFLARNYKALLETTSARDRTRLITRIYDLWLRMLTLTLVSQYLSHNRETLSDDRLNRLLEENFDSLTIDGWQKAFFTAMEAYKGNRTLFFMPELYDFYWDTNSLPHTPSADVQHSFKRLTIVSAELTQAGMMPSDESSWAELASELDHHLRLILTGTSFFMEYDLIRVLEIHRGTCTVELFKGSRSDTRQESIPAQPSLFPGRFYLRSKTDDFLSLHPLLIFWDTEVTDSHGLPPEVALYNDFIQQQLQYVKSISGGIFAMQGYTNGFIEFIYGTLDDIKKKHRQAKQLTWDELRSISAEITDQRMKTAQGKYTQDVYLERQHTLDELLQFLDSDKRCFVLIGRSGVGKSSFLLSFNQYLRQTRSQDVAVLMYDGALLHFEKSLDESIKQDFENRLVISDKSVEDIWQEIAKIPKMDDPKRRVILCVDAINESAQAVELLKRLDNLVQRAPWPWLKVIFSSRPETWQAIRHGVNLDAAKYYRAAGSDSVENTLEPFNYSEQMDPFSPQELPEAYAKYQAKYSLQTPFTELPLTVREVLREPLNLLLVARTYAGSVIPKQVRVTKLVEEYVLSLIERGLLEQDSIQLLQQRLIPLMVNLHHYDNKVTQKEISAAGNGLHEAIYSEHVNQSFIKLVDASILTHQKTENALRGGRSIAFKYERFYEYFIGERLSELSAAQVDRASFFLGLIEETAEKPFLWGAVRNALLQKLDTGEDVQTIVALCYASHVRAKEMMIDALIMYGRDHPEEVVALLRRLIPRVEKTSSLQQVRQFLGGSGKAFDVAARNAGKIAVEVASNLAVTEILQRAGLQPDPTLRAAAVRYGYLLWQRDQRAGFAILDYLGKSAARSIIPNMAALESALGLSLLIFFDHPEDRAVVHHLQQLWHTIIGRILALNESSNRISKLLRGFIRERIFSLAISLSLRLINDLPENLPIKDKSVEGFFHRSPAEKALYRRLTGYINPEGAYTYEEMKQDFLAAIPIMDGVIQPISCIGLSVHLARNAAAALPLVKELFEAAENAPPPNLWLSGIAFALTPILDTDPLNREMFEHFFEMMERCQRYYALPGHSAAWISAEAPEAIFLGQYIYYNYKQPGVTPKGWLESRINSAFEQKNEKFFKLLLTVHLPLVAFEMRAPQPVFDTLALFFRRRNEMATIEGALSALLGQMRTRYPDAVDSFLEDQEAPPEFRLQVITSESPETVGDLLGLQLFRVAFSLLVSGPPTLRDQLIRFFAKAADCKDIRALIDYLIREVINLIYQGEALRQVK